MKVKRFGKRSGEVKNLKEKEKQSQTGLVCTPATGSGGAVVARAFTGGGLANWVSHPKERFQNTAQSSDTQWLEALATQVEHPIDFGNVCM